MGGAGGMDMILEGRDLRVDGTYAFLRRFPVHEAWLVVGDDKELC